MPAAPCPVEIGKMRSAGLIESSELKNTAVSVTLKAPVYTSLIKLPRSKMMVCSCLNRGRKLVTSCDWKQQSAYAKTATGMRCD